MSTTSQKLLNLFVQHNLEPKKIFPQYNGPQDFDWIVSNSGLPWLKLNFNVPVNIIHQEILSATNFFVSHRDSYNEHQGWESFCIHGKSLTQTENFNDNRLYHWIPEVVDRMPNTVEFFKSLPGPNYLRLRVMALKPGGFIGIHSDMSKSNLYPVNIAITQPHNCHFIMEGWGPIPFTPGDAYFLDVSNRHALVNNSDQVRYHIIIHYETFTDEFKKMVKDCYDSLE